MQLTYVDQVSGGTLYVWGLANQEMQVREIICRDGRHPRVPLLTKAWLEPIFSGLASWFFNLPLVPYLP
ncbi:hypothetical protein BS297_09465 [Rhodococcus erythropolis]|uniref:Uncharacterized protein n=1 Tax=Rhodococcus erythropolis TaxID=1833 RepID=A0A0C2VHT8_RHOER|nr:hypothetical protein BS297_09465 [Rhodococcus erythropolis]KIM14428.1 hypothetical protein QV65_32030 [Rhodococcus erythropolis]